MLFFKTTLDLTNKQITPQEVYDSLLTTPMVYLPIWFNSIDEVQNLQLGKPITKKCGNVYESEEVFTEHPSKINSFIKFNTYKIIYLYSTIDGVKQFFTSLEDVETPFPYVETKNMLTFPSFKECFNYLMCFEPKSFDIVCVDGFVLDLEEIQSSFKETKGFNEEINIDLTGLYLTKANMLEVLKREG